MENTFTYLAFCPKHGFETHDGTKNECCDAGGIIPMFDTQTFARLNDKGQQMYHGDFAKLTKLDLSHTTPEIIAWANGMNDFLNPIEEVQARPVAQVEEVDEMNEGDDPAENTLFSAYMHGVEEGFALGYGKGYDAGHRLSVMKQTK